MFKFECIHADTCLPDYWGGHHLPHVSIPVTGPMTLKEIKQALHSEISEGAIAGSTDPYGMPENWIKALRAAVNRISNRPGFRGKHFKDIPIGEELDYSCYAYFVFTERE